MARLRIALVLALLACPRLANADDGKPADPVPSDPKAADPEPTKPEPTKAEPEPTEPEPTEPAQPEPEPTEPAEPAEEEITLGPDGPESDAEANARAAYEDSNPRSELPANVVLPQGPGWDRRLEIGADIALVFRPTANALAPSAIDYEPAVGWGIHLHWNVFSWLRLHPYFVDAHHDLNIPAGALVSGASTSVGAQASFSDATVETFVFGVKLAPTLNISERFRVWISAGLGWGRFEYPTMTVTEVSGESYDVRERAGVFAEVPIGLGISFDLIPRWMAIEYEATGAPAFGQSGSAYEAFQVVDSAGQLRDVGAFGAADYSIVQTLGLSLIL